MRSKLPWKHILLMLMFAIVWKIIEGSSMMGCEGLQCYNNSPCRIQTIGQQTTAECVCQQGWTGRTCQTRVHLKVIQVTMTTVKLKVKRSWDIDGDLEIDLNNADMPTQLSNYSIHYWKGDFSNMCNIVTITTTSDIVVDGLVNDTKYTFCLITEHATLCNFDLVNHHDNVSYCSTARTSATTVTTVTGSVTAEVFYTFIVSCVVIVSLIILIAVLVISIRKKYFTYLIGARRGNRRQSYQRNNSTIDDSVTQEMLLLTTPTTNQRIVINPPSSPGKPKNQLVNTKARGFATFSAKDDQAIALSTVIEYVDEDCESEDSFYDNQDSQQQAMFLRREDSVL